MTTSSHTVQPRLPSPTTPTTTLSREDREQFGARPSFHCRLRQHPDPMPYYDVGSGVAMHKKDIVFPTFPYHNNNDNSKFYMSDYEELNYRLRFRLEHPIISSSDGAELLLSEYAELACLPQPENKLRDVIAQYEARLQLLTDSGVQDDIELNESSERDFFSFIDLALYLHSASLVLLDNGNIRAVWKLSDWDRIGIQFRGNGMASYVIFKRISEGDVSRVAGLTSLEGVRAEIQKFDFEEELKRWPEKY